jgi:hypothetical protein
MKAGPRHRPAFQRLNVSLRVERSKRLCVARPSADPCSPRDRGTATVNASEPPHSDFFRRQATGMTYAQRDQLVPCGSRRSVHNYRRREERLFHRKVRKPFKKDAHRLCISAQ